MRAGDEKQGGGKLDCEKNAGEEKEPAVLGAGAVSELRPEPAPEPRHCRPRRESRGRA
jgi:hypothetical protein